MIDVIGTERYLTKIDGSHTIVFSATYGFPRGLVYINELAAQRQIQTGYSSTLRGDSLRAEFAVTCSRDQTPLATLTSVQQLRDSDRSISARAGDTIGPPVPVVLAGRPGGDDSESPKA